MAEEITNPIIPFEPRTTLTVDRANRLMGLKAHPGFNDLVRLSEETVRAAEAAVTEYSGWDKDELVARSIAFRAAKRSHEMLFTRMAQAIQDGVAETLQQRSEQPLTFDAREADAMAEDLRAEVLRQIDEQNYDTRVSGTY